MYICLCMQKNNSKSITFRWFDARVWENFAYLYYIFFTGWRWPPSKNWFHLKLSFTISHSCFPNHFKVHFIVNTKQKQLTKSKYYKMHEKYKQTVKYCRHRYKQSFENHFETEFTNNADYFTSFHVCFCFRRCRLHRDALSICREAVTAWWCWFGFNFHRFFTAHIKFGRRKFLLF